MNKMIKAIFLMLAWFAVLGGSAQAAPGDTLFSDSFERVGVVGGSNTSAAVGGGWAVGTPPVAPATALGAPSAACAGVAGNVGCAGIDSDIPPFNNIVNPRANATRAMFTRWSAAAVESPVINLAGRPAAVISFWLRRGSDCFSEWPSNNTTPCGGVIPPFTPTTGEEFQVHYLNNLGAWVILAQYPMDDAPGETLAPTIELPLDALHAGFKLRFIQPGGSGSNATNGGAPGVQGYDYWHIDDVVVKEAAIVPYVGPFCETFESGLSRWSIAGVGNVQIGSTHFANGAHNMDLRWGSVSATTYFADITAATGNVTFWVKRGIGAVTTVPNTTGSDQPEANENLVASYFNNVGVWTTLATYTGGGTGGQIFNGSFPIVATMKHAGFRLRFAFVDGAAPTSFDQDYWHVDNVCVGMAMPAADMALVMMRDTLLVPGQNATYTLTATNNGPDADAGALTVTDALPAGLTYVSASGAGWSCSAVGQNVTCSHAGPHPAGVQPALILTVAVAPTATGTVINSATVTGTAVDNTPVNNTASDAYTIVPQAYAYYAMDEATWTGAAGEVKDSSGSNRNATALGGIVTVAAPAAAPKGDTCRAGNIPANAVAGTPQAVNTGIDVNSLGNAGTLSFWYKSTTAWNSGTDRILLDASNALGGQDFYLSLRATGRLRFRLNDAAGTQRTAENRLNTATAANTWKHVAVTWDFTAGTMGVYVDGVLDTAQDLVGMVATPNAGWGNLHLGDTISGVMGIANSANGAIDEVRLYNSTLTAAQIAADMNATHACMNIHHFEISHPSGAGVTCTPSTLTITACANAACTTTYTGGVTTASFSVAGTPTLNWSGGSAVFSIPSGVATTTKGVQVTTPGSVVFGATSTPAPATATTCNFGTPSCTFTAADSGFIVNAPNHNAETVQIVTIQAVKKADNSLSCAPGLTGAKTVNLKCAYINPASGTLPVRVAGTALNAGNNAAAACDANGANVSLTFDAAGIATPSLQYADVGNMSITATHSGTAGAIDAGLVMTGSDTFIVAPDAFSIAGVTAGPIKAGNAFSATVSALNAAGNPAPNFGKETAPESVTLSSMLVTPDLATFPAASNPAPGNNVIAGSEFGATGMVNDANGVATVNNLNWGEVGSIKLGAALTSHSYLGSGLDAIGSSATVGAFIPDHFDTAVIASATAPLPCPSGLTCPALYNGFVYSGQPFTVQVTARNLAGGITTNYQSTFGLSNNVALTVWDALGSVATQNPGAGVLASASVPSTAFIGGIGVSNTQAYTFAAVPTNPADIFLRAADTVNATVTSLRAIPATSVEGGVKVASGRIKLANAHGSELLPLPVTATIQYYNGTTWATSATDSLTSLANTHISLTNGMNGLSGCPATCPTSITPATIVFNNPNNGNARFTLSRPNVAGSVNLAVSIPANCATTPAQAACYLGSNIARATFGVYKGNNEFIYLRESY